MYNSVVIIFCVFAVYGAYALFREIYMLCSRKNKVVTAVRVSEKTADKLSVAEYCTQKYTYFESRAVLLCEDEVPEDINKYGLDVYVKFPRKESHDGRE